MRPSGIQSDYYYSYAKVCWLGGILSECCLIAFAGTTKVATRANLAVCTKLNHFATAVDNELANVRAASALTNRGEKVVLKVAGNQVIAERPAAGDFAHEHVVVYSELLDTPIAHCGVCGRDFTRKAIVVQVEVAEASHGARAFGPVDGKLASKLVIAQIQIVDKAELQVGRNSAGKVVLVEVENACKSESER